VKKYIALLVLISIYSCKSKQVLLTETKPEKDLTADKIIESANLVKNDFSTLYIKSSASYKDENQSQNVSAEIKIKKNEKILLELNKQGKTPIEIFRMKVLPYSKNSIQKKLVGFGLCKKIKFSSELKIKFKNFLKESYFGKTPQELVDLWNSQNNVKVNKSKICKYLSVYNLRLPEGETIKINNLKKKEAEIKKQEAINPNRKDTNVLEAIRKARVEFMIKRAEKNRNIWSGLPLSQEEIRSIQLETQI